MYIQKVKIYGECFELEHWYIKKSELLRAQIEGILFNLNIYIFFISKIKNKILYASCARYN